MNPGSKYDHSLKSETTLKVSFKQLVAVAIFRLAKCDHGLKSEVTLTSRR